MSRFALVPACLLVAAVASGVPRSPRPALPPEDLPLLVVLQDTGEKRDGLPVFRRHPDARRVERQMQRGFPAHILRLYRWTQIYLHAASGAAIEPAYLEFSSRQGGFPEVGFWLGRDLKREAGYVDLYEQRRPRAGFGGIDQIFPHELAHVMMRQVLGPPPPGRSTQGHAIAVRTDVVTAFNEGFAEHCQIMALDDRGADDATRELVRDPYWKVRAERDIDDYRRATTARWAPGARARVGFLFWYSGDEQVLRYHAVKANAFARQPQIPERLLSGSDPYPAYLMENILPGRAADRAKTPAQMLATEGVVSTLFWRLATSEVLRDRYQDDSFYSAFGAARAEVQPMENFYLKLVYAFSIGRPATTAQALASYRAAFPGEAAAVDSIVREVSLGQGLAPDPEIWLANPGFRVGTRVFDQFRAAPRVHTFDLNAASLVDLVAVPGVGPDLARQIRRHAPYTAPGDLARVPGLPKATLARFEQMAAEMTRISAMDEASAGLEALLWSFGRRALALWAIAAVAGAFAYRQVRRCGWPRALVAGAAAALAALAGGWMVGLMVAAAAPMVLFAIPGALLALFRRPIGHRPVIAVAAWLAAAAPALLLLTPLF